MTPSTVTDVAGPARPRVGAIPRQRCQHVRGPVPEIRPFRALRYEPETVGDLATVVAPPYDVIKPAEHQVLLLRNPKNIVRLDLPSDDRDDAPNDKYRRAARTLAA